MARDEITYLILHLCSAGYKMREAIKEKKKKLIEKYGESLFENEDLARHEIEITSMKALEKYLEGNNLTEKFEIFTEDKDFSYPELKDKYLLLFDPIDGTNNYLRSIGESTISMAMSKGYKPQDLVGGVVVRLRKNEVLASIGSHNYKYYKSELDSFLPNGKYVDRNVKLENSVAVIDLHLLRKKGSLSVSNLIEKVKSPRYFGCVSKSLVDLGIGKVDIVVGSGRPWDYAAALLYAKNSGKYFAFINPLHGEEIFRDKSITYVSAASKRLLEEVLQIISPHYKILSEDDRFIFVESYN